MTNILLAITCILIPSVLLLALWVNALGSRIDELDKKLDRANEQHLVTVQQFDRLMDILIEKAKR